MASIGFAILVLDEEIELEDTYQTHKDAFVERGLDHEIFIINDGSTDRTGFIADEIAARDPLVKVIHHKNTLGFGYGYKGRYPFDGQRLLYVCYRCQPD